jgi:hypothetical protein
MANWEVTKTKRYNKPIEEHHANLKGGSYRIEVAEGSRMGVLYRWDDLRGYERIASGDIASLKSQAERMTAKQSRGVAGIERLANMSRPGAKDMMAVEEGQVDVDGVKYRVLPYQLEYFKTDLAKFDDPKWRKQVVQQYLAKNYIKRFSRPGAKDMMAVEDRFYFGKGRKERFAGKSASGESDLRDLLRQYWLAKGDESEKTKVDRGFLKAVMNRPAYRSPDPYVAAGQSTHELANKIWRLIDPRFGRQYLI